MMNDRFYNYVRYAAWDVPYALWDIDVCIMGQNYPYRADLQIMEGPVLFIRQIYTL